MKKTYKKRTHTKTGDDRKPQCSQIDPQTRDLLSNIVGNYIQSFGFDYTEQKIQYKKEVGGRGIDTLIKVRRKHGVNDKTIKIIFAHFGLVVDKDYLAATGIIRHVAVAVVNEVQDGN
jgi:hypothetical protein